MLELGPAFIKVGQVLSTRPDIVPPTYVEAFASLQDEVPEDAGGDPLTVVEAELGDDLDLETLEPVAGGSLAFVYTAEYEGERIALKVRRPGIVSRIERDLRVISGFVPLLAAFADERQQYSIENVADDFENIILQESWISVAKRRSWQRSRTTSRTRIASSSRRSIRGCAPSESSRWSTSAARRSPTTALSRTSASNRPTWRR